MHFLFLNSILIWKFKNNYLLLLWKIIGCLECKNSFILKTLSKYLKFKGFVIQIVKIKIFILILLIDQDHIKKFINFNWLKSYTKNESINDWKNNKIFEINLKIAL